MHLKLKNLISLAHLTMYPNLFICTIQRTYIWGKLNSGDGFDRVRIHFSLLSFIKIDV